MAPLPVRSGVGRQIESDDYVMFNNQQKGEEKMADKKVIFVAYYRRRKATRFFLRSIFKHRLAIRVH